MAYLRDLIEAEATGAGLTGRGISVVVQPSLQPDPG